MPRGQAFKVTGFPILAKAAERMTMRYKRHLRGLDKENANPFSLVIASIDPDSLSLLFQGLYSGASSRIPCRASVPLLSTSPKFCDCHLASRIL